MIRVFLDASVLFAAAYSESGASREIVRQAIRGTMRLVTSPLVLEETRRNFQELVSLDRRHLVGQPYIAQRSGLQIVLPDELLKELR